MKVKVQNKEPNLVHNFSRYYHFELDSATTMLGKPKGGLPSRSHCDGIVEM